MEWKEVKLGEIASMKYGKLPPKDVTTGDVPVNSGYRYIGLCDSINCVKDTIIVVARGVGGCGDVKIAKEDCYLTNLSIAVELNKNICVPAYFYYKHLLSNLSKLNSGSAQPQITIDSLSKYEISLPPLSTQSRIASILSSLDSKIETNNKINAKLEEMAQALFKSWFVDFEPFKDKGMVESELGMIPEGWRVGKLEDICCYSKQSIGVDDLNLSTYFSTENMLPNKAGVVIASSLPKVKSTTGCIKFDVIISNIRPYFKKIYRIDQPCGCSNDVMCFHPLSSEWSTYMYRVLYEDSFFNYVMSGAKGTKMPRGDKKQIMNYQIIMPEKETLLKFSNIVEPICNTIRTNQKESSRLSLLRDTLLPKLMSGEIEL